MAFRLFKLFTKDVSIITKPLVRNKSQRRTLGKPPGIARSLGQRLEEINYVDPNIFYKVDIGFPQSKKSRKEITKEHTQILKSNRNNPELEEKSRKKQLIIPLEEVEKEWAQTLGPHHIKNAAEHYSVFEHLYGDAYFLPNVRLQISFKYDDFLVPVYRGNCLKPSYAIEAPEVSFESDPDSLWTLLMTTPDGHFTSEKSEYVHWFIGNIKGSDVNSGEVIVDYLQPFPVLGAGYYRYIFVLYKQEGKIDYANLKRSAPCLDLNQRTFSTYDFYKDRQDVLTPAGLGFFQADWDKSVRKVFHEKFDQPEPKYCYDFPQHYYKKQEWFPLKQPFNLYMDRYRDEKEIAKEYVLMKLKKHHPFRKPEPPLQFPNAVPFKRGTPSWLKTKIIKDRLKWGRINDY